MEAKREQKAPGSLFGKREKAALGCGRIFWLQCKQSPASRQPAGPLESSLPADVIKTIKAFQKRETAGGF